MTMKWMTMLCLGAALLLGLSLPESRVQADKPPASFAADKGPAKLEVGDYPAPVQEAYSVFASRCSRCHTLARAINTNLTASNWKLYVKKMMDKPNSGISPEQGKTIYKFLKFYQKVKDDKRKPAKR